MSNDNNAFQEVLNEKDHAIALLQERCRSLSAQLQTSLQNNNNNTGGVDASQQQQKKKKSIPLSPHAVNVNKNRSVERSRIGRNASIATRNVIDQILVDTQNSQKNSLDSIHNRISKMFAAPSSHMDYLNSELFAKDVLKLCKSVRKLLEDEPRVVFLQSPTYIFGDIHGNLEDLHFFSDNIWRLGMNLTAGNFLFLGDYVDRGMNCLETISYLLSMKQQLPNKVFLLRGNHETRDVNGWEEHYGERSFIWQCRNRFGDELGYRIWENCNAVFDRLPLSGVIDQDIFCVHGGIPRPISPHTTRIQDILSVCKIAGINPPYEHEDEVYQQVASDCIWSDPASEVQENSVDPQTGYGESLRGGGAICFGNKAVTDFLQQNNFSYIMRAHEAHADGVAISKGARVFTVFSTSKDHNQGNAALAGCILVDNDRLQVINRSPAYKNQYVHRRDSVRHLPESEIQKRMKLGLVTNEGPSDTNTSMETWEDLQEDEEEDMVLDTKRRSSVELDNMVENAHDSVSGSVAFGTIYEDEEDTVDGDDDNNMADA